jgi:hypothetical protein
MTVKGRVVGPDGQPVQDAWMFSRVIFRALPVAGRIWEGFVHRNARNGHFEVHGLAPHGEIPVHFLEPKHKLGATAYVIGKLETRKLITVRLGPCGTAKARLLDSEGKPLPGFNEPWLLSMVVTPGALGSIKARKEGLLEADEDYVTRIDPINYEQNPVSDAQGRITFPALIPGAIYRIIDRTTFRDEAGPSCARYSASSLVRCSTWAISGSRSLRVSHMTRRVGIREGEAQLRTVRLVGARWGH